MNQTAEHVHVLLDRVSWKELKVYAVIEGRPMTAILGDAVREYLDGRKRTGVANGGKHANRAAGR